MIAGLGAFAYRDFRPKAVTIGQRVFFFENPDEIANWMGLNTHEDTHRAQYREQGLLGFLRAYVFDPRQRMRWEIEAHHADLCYRTLTRVTPPQISWEREARWIKRYVSTTRELTPEHIQGELERELSPAFCRELLARIGVHELPRSEFPADGVLRGLLSPSLVADLRRRVALHEQAAPWSLPTDSLADPDAARLAWEVVGWAPIPEPGSGFLGLWGAQEPAERDAIALQMDSLQAEAVGLLARSSALPWFDPEIRVEPSYPDHLGRIIAARKAEVERAIAAGEYVDAEQTLRELLSLGLRIHGSTLQNAGREYSAELVRYALDALHEIGGGRESDAPADGDLAIFDAPTAPAFLATLPLVLEHNALPLSVRWGLLSLGYALVRCGDESNTGVQDAGVWLGAHVSRVGPWRDAAVERIRQWPRDGWDCGGLADRHAEGWRRTPERPPIHLAWRR